MKVTLKQVQEYTALNKSRNLSFSLRAFDDEQVEEIRSLYLQGVNVPDLALQFERCEATINIVIRGKHPYTYAEEERCLRFKVRR